MHPSFHYFYNVLSRVRVCTYARLAHVFQKGCGGSVALTLVIVPFLFGGGGGRVLVVGSFVDAQQVYSSNKSWAMLPLLHNSNY